jgi:hypothetical protein
VQQRQNPVNIVVAARKPNKQPNQLVLRKNKFQSKKKKTKFSANLIDGAEVLRGDKSVNCPRDALLSHIHQRARNIHPTPNNFLNCETKKKVQKIQENVCLFVLYLVLLGPRARERNQAQELRQQQHPPPQRQQHPPVLYGMF